MAISWTAQPPFSVGDRVEYYDRQHRYQVGKILRIEASWGKPGDRPWIVYTVSHPSYRNGRFHTSKIKALVWSGRP